MQAQATAKMIRVAPRKVRLLLDELRGKRVEDGLTLLRYSGKPSARVVAKVLASAAANAENNYNMSPNDLRVVAAYAGPGPSLKRFKLAVSSVEPARLSSRSVISAVLNSVVAG